MSTVLKGKDSGSFLNSSFTSDMANYSLDQNPDKNRKAHAQNLEKISKIEKDKYTLLYSSL